MMVVHDLVSGQLSVNPIILGGVGRSVGSIAIWTCLSFRPYIHASKASAVIASKKKLGSFSTV
jgi:hypothetical protein